MITDGLANEVALPAREKGTELLYRIFSRRGEVDYYSKLAYLKAVAGCDPSDAEEATSIFWSEWHNAVEDEFHKLSMLAILHHLCKGVAVR